jgi:hypothetical protein
VLRCRGTRPAASGSASVPRAIALGKNAAATQIRQVPGTSGRGVRAAVAGAPGEEPLIVVVMSLPPAGLAHAPQGAPLVLTSNHPCWAPDTGGMPHRCRRSRRSECLSMYGTMCKMLPAKTIDASAFLEDMQRQEHAGIEHRAGREHGSIWLAP